MPIRHNQYLDAGYICEEVIPDNRLAEGLAQLAVQVARGGYRDIRIVPGEIALDGSPWEFKDPSHVAYVKMRKKERGKGLRVVFPMLKSRKSGEYTNVVNLAGLLHSD